MTDHHDDDRIDAYLWDPKAPPAPEVRAVEAPLEALRFEPAPKGSIVWMTQPARSGAGGRSGSAWRRPRRCCS